jgi:putative ABC transport system substrate-binding protein
VIAAAQKTRSIPIVMGAIGSMPDQASLSHPTRNITGLTLADGSALDGKRLALLKDIAPRARRVAIVDVGPRDVPVSFPENVRKAASDLGVELTAARAENADALDQAIADAVKRGVDALLIADFPQAHIPGYQRVIHERAVRHVLPVIHTVLSAADTGGLAAYGSDILANYRRTPYFIDRILRGAKPADLPIEQPSRYALIVNKSGARAIALTLPPGVLARADRIIE